LQRALVQDEATFGTMIAGSPEDPGVSMESVHFLKKLVADAGPVESGECEWRVARIRLDFLSRHSPLVTRHY